MGNEIDTASRVRDELRDDPGPLHSESLLSAAALAVASVLLTRSIGPLGVVAVVAAALLWSSKASSWAALGLLCALPAALGALEPRAETSAPPDLALGPRRLAVRLETAGRPSLDALEFEVSVLGSGFPVRTRCELRGTTDPSSVQPGDKLYGIFLVRPSARGPRLRSDLRALRVEPGRGPRTQLARLRARLRQGLERHTRGETGRVLCHLVLGRGAPPSEQTVFAHRATGLAHLLAVSGAHTSLLAGMLAVAFRNAQARGRRAVWIRHLSTAILLLYGFLTGMEPPVVRALIAWTVLTYARARGRRVGWPTLLAFPALCTALFTPADLSGVSFWLSYAAVLGLAAAGPYRRGGVGTAVLASARASAWAACTTAPIALSVFGSCSPWTIVGTPVCGPLIAASLGLGLLVTILDPLLPGVAALLAIPLQFLGDLYLEIVHELSSWPGTPILAEHSPHPVVMVAALILAAAVLLGRPTRRRLLVACLLTSLPSFMSWPREEASDRFRLLAVGHGQAALLETKDGNRVLIDCGTLRDGRRAARAVLRASKPGRRRLDLLVLTHADFDHWGGVPELCQSVPITRAVLAEGLRETRVPEALQEASIPYRFVTPGERFQLLQNLDVVAPDLGDRANDNERSLWLRFDGEFSVLLPADAEGKALDALIDDPLSEDVDVLVLPHHGRVDPERSRRLQARCQAQEVLVSAPGAGEQEVTRESLQRGTWVLRPPNEDAKN